MGNGHLEAKEADSLLAEQPHGLAEQGGEVFIILMGNDHQHDPVAVGQDRAFWSPPPLLLLLLGRNGAWFWLLAGISSGLWDMFVDYGVLYYKTSLITPSKIL